MVAARISAARPGLLQAVLEARDHELERGESLRTDLLEFATFCLLVELTGGRLAHDPVKTPFTVMLSYLTDRYRNPRLCRALFALAKDGLP